ncbi:hypothetical protein BO221_28040 [Archangium sp. Cb G35]|uniref:serine/threonine protein kinase n=1 Tax=Archangium sp. Cb G35 TaxID=1920190 RepID=UPI000936D519|nr:serine/threonine-protein kinase [Archangium sp. Cb G35]OJT21656.1 hypothetical protein BO221_28040 [Archangium sp. Cb G35]
MLDEDGQLWGTVPELTPGTEVAGFTIEGTIASGSFGTVYRARRSGRPYAVKLVRITPRGDREAAALRLLRHPNVVTFHGYGLWPEEEPCFLVLALELVEGRTLDVWAAEENPSALELVMRVLLPLALTLADVHASGVVHRDIKEANIIVRESDGQPVLVDFGAAGLKEGALRLTMRLPPGTAEYRSPEALRFAKQWEGEHYPFSPGDDLWAMGVIIYGLLTRTLPFGDRNNPGLNRAILEETPSAPHELNPRVPQVLSDVCMGLLEKKLEDRYPDAKALAADLLEQCTEVDYSWRTPMFPRSGQEKSSPSPAPGEPRRQLPWQWWVAGGLVLTAALLLLVSGVTPRKASPTSSATPQGNSGQEVVAPAKKAEVVPGAALPPAPVAAATNSEEPKMKKTIRTLVAAGCVAGSPGCVSGPQSRPPPPAECPPGAAATHKYFGMVGGHGAAFPPFDKIGVHPVREGPITTENIGDWGTLPDRALFTGRVFFGKDRVYARFTQVRLLTGEVLPICLEMVRNADLGLPKEPGSKGDVALIVSSVSVVPVRRFE